MSKPRDTASVTTTSRLEHLSQRLTGLMPRTSSLTPRGAGSTVDAWKTEDAATLSGILGSWAQQSPSRRFPALLLELCVWPDKQAGPGELLLLMHTTSGLLRARLAPDLERAPPLVARALIERMDNYRLTAMLLDELIHPAPCGRCRGHGQILRSQDEDAAPVVMVCPKCSGAAQGPRPFKRRAQDAGIRAEHWLRYAQPGFSLALRTHHYLIDCAVQGVEGMFKNGRITT